MPDLTSRAGTLYLVHVLTHATRSRLDSLLADVGLSGFHYTILKVIGRYEGLSSSRLSRRFHVTPQAMGEVMLLLEKRDLIARSEDPANRKVLHLSLTPLARKTLLKADRIVKRFEKEIFAGRTEAELVLFRDIIAAALSGLREG